MFKNQIYRDFRLIIFLLFLSYVAVYIAPDLVRALIFMVIIYFFIKSKNNAPWIIFFFLILSSPAMLFYRKDSWFLVLTSTVGIPFSFIISLAFLFKGFIYRKNFRSRFSIEKNIYIFYLLFLFFVGLIYGGLEPNNIFSLFIVLPNIILVLFLPVIIDLKKDYQRIKKLLFIFTIVLFIIQFFEVVLGRSIFGVGHMKFNDELQRNITASYFVFFSLIIALSDLISRSSKKKTLAYVSVFSSILIFINAGTRGWLIAIFFMLISILVLGNKPKVVFKSVVLIGLLGSLLFFTRPNYLRNIEESIDRFSTVMLVLEGDKTAGGTLSRLTDRGPVVINEFKKSPLFGFGFSDRTFEYYDGHVANQSILLQSGLIGFTLLYLIIGKVLWYFFKGYLYLKKDNIYKFKVLSMIIGFMGIMVIHFTSQQMYGYNDRAEKYMLIAFWFLFTFYYLDEAKEYARR